MLILLRILRTTLMPDIRVMVMVMVMVMGMVILTVITHMLGIRGIYCNAVARS